jgi:hypothetical protein
MEVFIPSFWLLSPPRLIAYGVILLFAALAILYRMRAKKR